MLKRSDTGQSGTYKQWHFTLVSTYWDLNIFTLLSCIVVRTIVLRENSITWFSRTTIPSESLNSHLASKRQEQVPLGMRKFYLADRRIWESVGEDLKSARVPLLQQSSFHSAPKSVWKGVFIDGGVVDSVPNSNARGYMEGCGIFLLNSFSHIFQICWHDMLLM